MVLPPETKLGPVIFLIRRPQLHLQSHQCLQFLECGALTNGSRPWMFLTLLLQYFIPLLQGNLVLLLSYHFNLLNDVFHQQLEHIPITDKSPSSRDAPSSTASPLKKAASFPGRPYASCNIADGPTVPSGFWLSAP